MPHRRQRTGQGRDCRLRFVAAVDTWCAAQIVERLSQGSDHPVPQRFPESAADLPRVAAHVRRQMEKI